LWIISAGEPESVLEELGFAPDPAWESGVYGLAAALGVYVVVVSRLPRRQDTRRTSTAPDPEDAGRTKKAAV
jgi:hypothetical protein